MTIREIDERMTAIEEELRGDVTPAQRKANL